MLVLSAAGALAQSSTPAVFVANNGNVDGSVTSYRVNPDGTVAFVQKLTTGLGSGNAGTNAYAIDISPNGRFLAVTHATAATSAERVNIIEVGPDAALTSYAMANIPDSPLDVVWIDDSHFAATQTSTTGTNRVRMYGFNAVTRGFSYIGQYDAGVFCAYMALSPDRRFLYAVDNPLSSTGRVLHFAINANFTLSFIGAAFSNGYALGPAVSPDGRFLYVGGGASTLDVVTGYTLDNAGVPTEISGSPYFSPGDSPKQVAVSPDGRFAFAAHGSSATINAFEIDQSTGALTSLPFSFDTGIQGSLGEITTLRAAGKDLLFATDSDYSTVDTSNRKGLLSFTIHADGSFTQNGTIVDSQGVSPDALVAWAGTGPACGSADFNGDGDVGTDADIEAFFACLAGNCCPACGSADFNADGDVGTDADIEAFFRVLAGGSC